MFTDGITVTTIIQGVCEEMNTTDRQMIGRENLLRGNWGEQYVSERLSSCDCFVRHVPQGHDTGVDLYCETTSDDKRPFQHFWCQVKTSRRLKGKNPYITLNRQSKNMKVDYWLKQPIPVFVFVVPDRRNEDNPKEGMIPFYFYIFSAIDFHNNNETIKSVVKIEKIEDLKKFLNEDLLIETFRWDLKSGRVSHLLTSNPSYTITFPKGQTLEFEQKLQESLRWTLRLLADNILDRNDSDSISKAQPYVKMLKILASSIHDEHYETYEVIGKYYHRINDSEKALKNYKTSLELLNKDSKVSRSCMQWKQVFEHIEATITDLESGVITPERNENMGVDVCATKATTSNITISG